MSREIKFRVWDKKRKKMCEVHNLAFHDLYGYKVITTEKAADGGEAHTVFTSIEDFELIEFTGLYDKYGVKIYEGDILLEPIREYVGAVKFEEGSFLWEFENITQSLFEACDELEVIGNIYDKEAKQVSLF